MKTNTIAKAILTRRGLPSLARSYGVHSCTLQAIAKLEHFGGNRQPHFSVTGTIWAGTGPYSDEKDIAGGCLHEDILRVFPKLAPLIALHLSDADGQPTYAAANGLYWLAGFVPGNLAQEYHGANGSSAKTPEECKRTLCEHLRITEDEADSLAAQMAEVCDKVKASVATSEEITAAAQKEQRKQARIALGVAMNDYCETQRARWQAEADAGLALIRELAAADAQPATV